MSPRLPRRFTIADAMILVIAAAVGSLLARSFLPEFLRIARLTAGRLPTGFSGWVLQARSWGYGPVSCVVVPLMLAAIVLRLRAPRPRWRRIMRQPGFVACVAITVSLVPGLAWYAATSHRPGFQRPGSFSQVWYAVTHWSATAVPAAWIVLAMGRRWRVEASWVDRLGRLLGFFWVVLMLVDFAGPWIQNISAWLK